MWVFNSKEVTKVGERPFGGEKKDKVELGAVRVGPSQKSIT